MQSCEDIIIRKFVAKGNKSSLWAGAISMINSVQGFLLDDLTIENNVGGFYGGGIFYGYNSNGISKMTNSFFKNNTANTLGGAIFDYFTGNSLYENIKFDSNNCVFG